MEGNLNYPALERKPDRNIQSYTERKNKTKT